MDKKQQPYNINYTFHVQSVEDFYGQMRSIADQAYAEETEITDTRQAQQMLNQIGVRCG
jgi:Mg2+ and Co2+ transporter CorA